MNKPLYQYIKESKTCGVYGICGDFGAAVWDLTVDDCISAWSSSQGYHTAHRHKVYYSTAGRPFIRKGSLRLYLDEFMRT